MIATKKCKGRSDSLMSTHPCSKHTQTFRPPPSCSLSAKFHVSYLNHTDRVQLCGGDVSSYTLPLNLLSCRLIIFLRSMTIVVIPSSFFSASSTHCPTKAESSNSRGSWSWSILNGWMNRWIGCNMFISSRITPIYSQQKILTYEIC